MQKIGSVLNGEHRLQEEKTMDVLNPYNQETIATIACASIEDVHEAIEVAQQTFNTT
ncbi:MAG: aldehyde dehydrogenase family protein, partial [Sporosarcina sp.]